MISAKNVDVCVCVLFLSFFLGCYSEDSLSPHSPWRLEVVIDSRRRLARVNLHKGVCSLTCSQKRLLLYLFTKASSRRCTIAALGDLHPSTKLSRVTPCARVEQLGLGGLVVRRTFIISHRRVSALLGCSPTTAGELMALAQRPLSEYLHFQASSVFLPLERRLSGQ